MEDVKKNEGTTAPATDTAEAMRQKYGKVYKVGITIPIDDEESKDFSYHPSYDRYIKTASKIGMTKASKTFMLDAVVDEDRERLAADMEEYPGVAITIGNKLTELLGLTDGVNLRKL